MSGKGGMRVGMHGAKTGRISDVEDEMRTPSVRRCGGREGKSAGAYDQVIKRERRSESSRRETYKRERRRSLSGAENK